jgi:hypothetical protein
MSTSLKIIIRQLQWDRARACGAGPLAPIVRVEDLRQISAHVYIIPDNSVPTCPTSAISAIAPPFVIDTGLGPPNGAAIYKVAKTG